MYEKICKLKIKINNSTCIKGDVNEFIAKHKMEIKMKKTKKNTHA